MVNLSLLFLLDCCGFGFMWFTMLFGGCFGVVLFVCVWYLLVAFRFVLFSWVLINSVGHGNDLLPLFGEVTGLLGLWVF